MVRLADRKRRQYAAYQPVFWRLAPSARAQHEKFLAGLVDDPDVLSLVATLDEEVRGFVVGRLVPAPPTLDHSRSRDTTKSSTYRHGPPGS
jgi:hypothetical protein